MGETGSNLSESPAAAAVGFYVRVRVSILFEFLKARQGVTQVIIAVLQQLFFFLQ